MVYSSLYPSHLPYNSRHDRVIPKMSVSNFNIDRLTVQFDNCRSNLNLLSIHKWPFYAGSLRGGIVRKFPVATHIQYASPQIPPWRDAARAKQQRDFVSI